MHKNVHRLWAYGFTIFRYIIIIKKYNSKKVHASFQKSLIMLLYHAILKSEDEYVVSITVFMLLQNY